MKKKFIAAAVVAVMGVSAYVGVSTGSAKESMNQLALSNVEALSDTEIGVGRWIVIVYSPSRWRCDSNGGASCPGTPW